MFEILNIFNQVAFFTNKKTLLQQGGIITFDEVLDKTTFSDGLKKSLKEVLKNSGYKDFSELKGKTIAETQKNLENKVDGFSSGKNTYLQANQIAKVIHGIIDSTYPYKAIISVSNRNLAYDIIRKHNGIILLEYPTGMGYEFKVGSYDWKVLEEIQIELSNENILNHQYEAKPDNAKLSNMLNAIVVIDSPEEIHSQKTEQALKYLILKKGYKTNDILLQMNFVTTDEVENELLNQFRKHKNLIALNRDLEKETFSKGGKVSKSHKQYAKEVDAYKWFIINIEKKKTESGWEYRGDADEALQDYDGDANYKVVAEKTLSKYGIENPKEKWKKYKRGGNVKDNFFGSDEYWEKRENLERFLSYNDDAIYWKWINEEINDNEAIILIKEIHGIDFNPDEKYAKGGEMPKLSNLSIYDYLQDYHREGEREFNEERESNLRYKSYAGSNFTDLTINEVAIPDEMANTDFGYYIQESLKYLIDYKGNIAPKEAFINSLKTFKKNINELFYSRWGLNKSFSSGKYGTTWGASSKYLNTTKEEAKKIVDTVNNMKSWDELKYSVKSNIYAKGGSVSDEEIEKQALFYFSDRYNLTKYDLFDDLVRYIELQKGLNGGTIPPRQIVGTGYKNARKVAEEWLEERIKLTKYLIENFDKKNVFTEEQLEEARLKNEQTILSSGGDISSANIFQIKDTLADKYYSLDTNTGKAKWQNSPDMGYMYSQEEANKIKDYLVSEGNSNIEVVKYNKDWWKS